MADEKPVTIGHFINRDAESYAIKRKFAYKQKGNKKITPENFRKELMVARILGEMSGAERVIKSLVANPDWTREDLEGEIHKFVVDCNNNAASILGSSNLIGIEDVLECHEYYEEKL